MDSAQKKMFTYFLNGGTVLVKEDAFNNDDLKQLERSLK